MLRKEMSYRLCIVHNMNKKTCEKKANFNIYVEKFEKMSYSKSTKTIKNFDRVDGQKKRQQDGQKKHNSRLRRKCAEALTKKEDLL